MGRPYDRHLEPKSSHRHRLGIEQTSGSKSAMQGSKEEPHTNASRYARIAANRRWLHGSGIKVR